MYGVFLQPSQVIIIFTSPPRKDGQILKGGIPEVVNKLVDLLKNEVV